jgi:hypothetical protein
MMSSLRIWILLRKSIQRSSINYSNAWLGWRNKNESLSSNSKYIRSSNKHPSVHSPSLERTPLMAILFLIQPIIKSKVFPASAETSYQIHTNLMLLTQRHASLVKPPNNKSYLKNICLIATFFPELSSPTRLPKLILSLHLLSLI